MQLQEAGMLDLDQDVSTYLGVQFRNPHFPDMKVTSRHLLMHRSSLMDYDDAVNIEGPYKTMDQDCDMTLEQYTHERVIREGPGIWYRKRPPGHAYHYSNAGMTVLGWVIERVSDQSLSVLAQDRIFNRLGMSRSKYLLSEARELQDSQLAAPGGSGRHYGLAELPAAGLRSTASDLARFLEAFTADTNPLLSRESVNAMLPPDFTQGLAWWGRDFPLGNPSGGSWEHGGFMQGVRTHMYLYPGRREGIVILSNGASYEGIHEALVQMLRV